MNCHWAETHTSRPDPTGLRTFDGDYRNALDAATGIEISINSSLLHDDVMDKADIRRGKPTVHVKWNENTAILSGDAMQIIAFMHMMKTPEKSGKPYATFS